MKSLTYAEIDLPYCSLTYGTAPCTATLEGESPTGTRPCFNTKSTCQDRENFAEETITWRFSEDSDHYPRNEIEAFASLAGVSYTPAIVSLGEDLGARASISVTFKNHRWGDTGPGGDKYLADRDYDPFKQGTFWGKFRARQPFLRGRALRLIRGFVGDTLANMETRHFIIESTEGPAPDGSFTIIAKDPLKMLDGDRAQAPALSGGFLVSGITADSTTAPLSPAGIGDEEYPLSGYVNIGGSEICAFTRDPVGEDSNTKLLLHFNGADGSQVFTDSSPSARGTATVTGDVVVDTSESVFGGASAYFDGSSYLEFPDHADWTLPSTFTVDLRVNVETLSGTQTIISHLQTPGPYYWQIRVNASGYVAFTVVNSSSTLIVSLESAAPAVTAGQFYHIAVVRNGNNWALYVDGTSVATLSDSDAIPDFSGTLCIGRLSQTGATNFHGWIDELRISRVARWTSNFTPPDKPYGSGPDILDLARGQYNTEAVAHEQDERVQLCLIYTVQSAAEIMDDLAQNYAGMPSEWIPRASWDAEIESFQGQVYTACIPEPTPVKSLWIELIQIAGLSVWWDDINEQIRLRVLREVPANADAFDRDVTLQGSFSSKDQPAKRVSQVWTYFGQINPLKPVDDVDNYRSCALSVDLLAETDYGGPAIKKRFARWIASFGRQIALRTGAITLSRYRDPPRRISFALPKNGPDAILGEGYLISAEPFQDDTGAPVDVPIQITRLRPDAAHIDVEAEEMRWTAQDDFDPDARNIIIDTNTLNLDLRERYDQLYPAPSSDKAVNVIIEAMVGSADKDLPAFDVGDWPADIEINIRIQPTGRIQGKGGDGGSAPDDESLQDGGDALYTRYAVNLYMPSGSKLYGGGTGGRAVRYGGSNPQVANGSGGQGFTPGLGATYGVYPGKDGTPDAPGAQSREGGAYAATAGGPAGADNGSGHPSLGTPGVAIDGDSYVTVVEDDGDIQGARIN